MIERARLEADNSISEARNRGQRKVQEKRVELMQLQNQTRVILEEDAKQRASAIHAEGDLEAVRVVEEARNNLLKQKVEMLQTGGEGGAMILFLQQQLPALFESYKKNNAGTKVDSFLLMDSKRGFSGAVNRGPAAFAGYLKYLEQSLGLSVKDLLGISGSK